MIRKNAKYIKTIEENREAIYPGDGIINLFESDDLEIQKPQHIFDVLDSQRQQENEDDKEIGVKDDPLFESFGYLGNLKQANEVQFEEFKYKKFCLQCDDEINFHTHRLVPEQLNILRKVVGYCKDVVRAQKNFNHNVKPLRLIIHGGQGNEPFTIFKIISCLNDT